MSSHVFHEIFVHINWHTKNDLPLIRPEIEPALFDYLRKRCAQTPGVYLRAIGGTATHVHLAMGFEPQVAISEIVGELKGASSREMNAANHRQALHWQRGFGVVSFGKGNLPWVREYVGNQKERHAKGTVHERLERTEPWERRPEAKDGEDG